MSDGGPYRSSGQRPEWFKVGLTAIRVADVTMVLQRDKPDANYMYVAFVGPDRKEVILTQTLAEKLIAAITDGKVCVS